MRPILLLYVAGLVPLAVALQGSPLLHPLPTWIGTNLPRFALLMLLTTVLLLAWRSSHDLLVPALRRPRGRLLFVLSTLTGLLLQWILSGALGRGAAPAGTSWVYGPIGTWPLLWQPLPGDWSLATGLGGGLLALTVALLAAAGITLAWDQRTFLQGAANSPALFAGATCPGCLPPLLALATTGGLTGSLAALSDPTSPVSALVVLLGPLLALAGLLFVQANLRRPCRTLGIRRPTQHKNRWPLSHRRLYLLLPGLAVPVLLLGLPRGDSVQQELIRNLFVTSLVVASIVVLVVFVWMIVYTLRYRDREEHAGPAPWKGTRRRAKVLFIAAALLVPMGLVYGIGIYSDNTLRQIEDQPEPTFFANVVGGQFRWEFHYHDGSMTQDTLYVPQGEVVQLNLTSKDVIHSLFIPSMGVKMDLVPGNVNQQIFEPTRTGTFQGYCAELCGRGHADMLFTLTVFDPDEFEPPFEWERPEKSET